MLLSFHGAARDDIEGGSRGRGETGRRNGLEVRLECSGGNPGCRTAQSRGNLVPWQSRAKPSMGRPRAAVLEGEGVETRRAAPTLQRGPPAWPEHGEGIVQTTNPPARGEAAKAVAGRKTRRAAMPVGVRVPPPAPLPLCSALGCGKKPCSASRKG